jgi:pantoate--beta-alanine ligase
MKIIKTIKEMKTVLASHREQMKIIGFVPTMGYLHQGHLSLIGRARQSSDIVVISIFVNPTQFGPQEDLARYPRDLKRDEELAEQEGADYIFYPDVSEMYPEGYKTYVLVEELSKKMCGASRPEHFRGVTTIVLKLLNIIQPHCAYFGQKDAQQAIIIRRMVEDLNLDVKIEVEPIVREADGLAMSSRNSYLKAKERKAALVLYHALTLAQKLIKQGERNSSVIISQMEKFIRQEPLARIDYISIVDNRNLQELALINKEALIALAVYIGKTRLIDNITIQG